jgi:hypothetical protein
MKIVVIGGSGLIGKKVVMNLVWGWPLLACTGDSEKVTACRLATLRREGRRVQVRTNLTVLLAEGRRTCWSFFGGWKRKGEA